MKTPDLVTQITESEGLRSSVEALATGSKTTTAAIVGNAYVLAAINTEAITGYAAFFSAVVSALTIGIIAAYWMIKTAREWKAMQRDDKQ